MKLADRSQETDFSSFKMKEAEAIRSARGRTWRWEGVWMRTSGNNANKKKKNGLSSMCEALD
jgi:hypothetical protein